MGGARHEHVLKAHDACSLLLCLLSLLLCTVCQLLGLLLCVLSLPFDSGLRLVSVCRSLRLEVLQVRVGGDYIDLGRVDVRKGRVSVVESRKKAIYQSQVREGCTMACANVHILVVTALGQQRVGVRLLGGRRSVLACNVGVRHD